MLRIALTAGHSVSSTGAGRPGVEEQPFCREVCNRAVALLTERGAVVFDPQIDLLRMEYPHHLRRRIAEINALHRTFPLDAAIEMHLNSSGDEEENYALALHRTGDGAGEMLGASLARRFHSTFSAYGTRFHVSTDKRWGRRLAFVREVQCPAVIAEPCFLSHYGVSAWLRDFRPHAVELLAQAYTDGIMDWHAERTA